MTKKVGWHYQIVGSQDRDDREAIGYAMTEAGALRVLRKHERGAEGEP